MKGLFSVFLFLPFLLLSQIKENRYGLVFIPTTSQNSYGLSIGPIGSETICGVPHFKSSYGLNFQIFGQGVI